MYHSKNNPTLVLLQNVYKIAKMPQVKIRLENIHYFKMSHVVGNLRENACNVIVIILAQDYMEHGSEGKNLSLTQNLYWQT